MRDDDITQPPKPTFEESLNEFIGRSMTVMGAEPTYGQVATFSREYGKREALAFMETMRLHMRHSVTCEVYDHGQPCNCGYADVCIAFEKLSGGGAGG